MYKYLRDLNRRFNRTDRFYSILYISNCTIYSNLFWQSTICANLTKLYIIICNLAWHQQVARPWYYLNLPVQGWKGIYSMSKNFLRQIRESLMLSKGELARKAYISHGTVTRIERGMPCRIETKRKIVLTLGYKISDTKKIF